MVIYRPNIHAPSAPYPKTSAHEGNRLEYAVELQLSSARSYGNPTSDGAYPRDS